MMSSSTARLAAWSLITGSAVASFGYAAGFVGNGTGPDRFAGPTWAAWYTVALLGNVFVLLGLPTVVSAQQGHCRRLTLLGYVGLFVPFAVLNVGEGTIEAYVKPYLAHHGGLASQDLPGLATFEAPALLVMLVGVVCLGIAVLRARVLPQWIGVAFLLVPVLGAAGLPGPAGLIADWLCYLALAAVGLLVLVRRAGEAGSTGQPPGCRVTSGDRPAEDVDGAPEVRVAGTGR